MDGEADIPAETHNWNCLKFVHALLKSVGVEFSSPNAELVGGGKDAIVGGLL
jgi:hypothetical protein